MIVPVVRAAGVVSTGNPNTPGAPTGKEDGDLLLLVAGSEVSPGATPTGWAAVPGSPVTNVQGGGNGAELNVWSRIADGSGDDTPSVTGTHLSRMICVQGGTFDPTDPFGAYGTLTFTWTAATLHDLATVTTERANSLVLLILGSSFTGSLSGWVNGNLADITEWIDDGTTFSNRSGIHLATGSKASAGAIGTTQAQHTAAVNAASLTLELHGNDPDKGVTPNSRIIFDEVSAGTLYKGSTLVWPP